MSRDGVEHAMNVDVCMRVGGKAPILTCASCHNEVEGTVVGLFADEFIYSKELSLRPSYNFCPWCSTPLKEVDNG
jgi:hypothetical protein